MRFEPRAVLACGAAVVALAACGSSSKSSGAAPTNPSTAATTTPAPTTQAAPTTMAAAAGKATVNEVMNAKIGKKILVDNNGKTLYVWDKDTTPGKATCTGVCAQAWPALYVTGTPTFGTGLKAAMFSTVTGPNGQKQLAVNGKPLYLWTADTAAGDATGQGVNGFYVVGTNGMKIDQS
jgi:predicted lipoprotein with Yx(FWY)xxD motif